MTFIEAAIIVLRDSGNLPMTANDIWEKIKSSNLEFKTNGKSPVSTLSALMSRSSLNSDVSYSRKSFKFEILDDYKPIKFRLINFEQSFKIEEEESKQIELQEEEIVKNILLYQVTSKEIGWKKLSVYNRNENIVYEITDCEEYTYIMEDKAHATIKIGKTKNDPEQRLNQLKTGNPSISLLHVFPSSQFSEGNLHKDFSDFQKDLEWFFFSKGIKKFINSEMQKHILIFESFAINKDLEDKEKLMLNLI